MSLIGLFGNPFLLFAAVIAFISGLVCCIKKKGNLTFKIFTAYWALIVIQMLILVVQFYLDMNREGMGYPDFSLLPTMAGVSFYSFTLTLFGTIILNIVEFDKAKLWISIILVLMSIAIISMSGSILYLAVNV